MTEREAWERYQRREISVDEFLFWEWHESKTAPHPGLVLLLITFVPALVMVGIAHLFF